MIPKAAARFIATRQDGLAAVEFAIVVPILLILLLAISEFSRAVLQYNTVLKSVRDGARFLAGTASPGSTGQVDLTHPLVQGRVDETRNLVVYGNVLGSGEPALPNWTADDVGVSAPDSEHIRVSATYQYTPILGSALAAFFEQDRISTSFPITAAITMRAL